MGRIYLVRHGRTAWNKSKVFRGRKDVPLDDQGRREAACVAETLSDVAPPCIYTSPLSRARETAQIIATPRGIEVRSDDAFVDIDFGAWTERSESEVREESADQYKLWQDSPHLLRFPGGEGLDDVRRRAVPRLDELAEAHREDDVAIVSHRVVLKVLLCAVDTGGICVLEWNGDVRLLIENDTGHLESLPGRIVEDF